MRHVAIAAGVALLILLGFMLGLSAGKSPASTPTRANEPTPAEAPPATRPATQPEPPRQSRPPAESTRRMAARLRQLINDVDLIQMPWVANHQRVAMFESQFNKATDPIAQANAELPLANEFLNDGQNAAALAHLEHFEKVMLDKHYTPDAQERQLLRLFKAMVYMRIGEMDNCCAAHNADSCLVPLKGEGIYTRKEAPRRAIELFSEQLKEFPNDLTSRWLLNVAYMTLGEYPARVPKQWLIDPKVFESGYDIKHFPDVAAAAGLDTFGLSGGCIVDDFDGDGFLDVVRSDIMLDKQMKFFHNNGDGTFTDRTEEAGLTGEVGGLNMISGDYNNDGHLDILVLRGGWFGKAGNFPLSLLRNNGDGTFTDVTEEAGLLTAHPTQTAVWFDYDGDGYLDLFVGNETTPGSVHSCQLFHNNRDGTFTECAEACGIHVTEFVKAVASADFLNTGRPGLYISQMGGASNILLRNDGPRDPANPKAGWKFTNVTQEAGMGKPIYSFPCFFFDYDNDGWPDLFVCGFAGGVSAVAAEYVGQRSTGEHPRLYHNNRDGTFTDVAPAMGLDMTLVGMSANFGDLDNHGFPDIYVGTGDPTWVTLVPNRMFRNDSANRFQDVTTSGGFGNLQKGHGIAFADINNDGQQDIFQVQGGAYSGDKYYSALYANPGHDNHWVTLKLEGVQTNRLAMGARIRVIVSTGTGERSIYRTVSTGGSFGCSPLRQEIGLGKAEAIREIQIFWPVTGRTQRIAGVPMDRFYTIREGDSAAVPLSLKSFAFRGMPKP